MEPVDVLPLALLLVLLPVGLIGLAVLLLVVLAGV
jgi:hypothetical protein